MIDIESIVFDAVAVALRTQFTGIWVAGEYVDAPASFPAVTIVEQSNTMYKPSMTANTRNRANAVMYEVNVFSNKVFGKKQEAKAIMEFIDEIMDGMGFTRTMGKQIPNYADASIYRYTARYTAVLVPDDNGYCFVHTN